MADERGALIAETAESSSLSLGATLLRALQSVRTTIYLLPALAIATTIGTIIPQARPASYYDMVYGPRWGRIVTTLGLDNVYNSTWFILLACVLLLNLAACVGRSFRRARRRYRGPAPEALARKLEVGAGTWQSSAATVDGHRLREALRRARYAVTEHVGSHGETWMMVRRWSFAHYAGILTHLAIFLVAIGAVLGRLPWTSLDRQITFAEGETYSDPDGRLGFKVRLEDFRMGFYEGTDQPSSYESDIVLLSNGNEVLRGTATVNRQVVYRGVAFGQSSWGVEAVRFSVTGPNGKTRTVRMGVAEVPGPHGATVWEFVGEERVAVLGEGKAALVGVQFFTDTKGGSSYPKHPGVALQLVTGLGSGKHQFHDLGLIGLGEERTAAGYRVRFDDIVYISTLSARKDPGLPLVWLGFILVSLGMTVMFYVRPRTFLVEISKSEKGDSLMRVAPLGRELAEPDRRIIEGACGARLAPADVRHERRSRRRPRT